MARTARLAVEIDSRGARRGGSEVDRELQRIKGSARGAQGELDRLGAAAKAAFAYFSVRQLQQWIDTATRVRSQLNALSNSLSDMQAKYKQVLDIAQRTRTDLEATTALYSTLTRSAGDLGASQAQVARITETVNKSFAITGTDGGTAAGAIRQLSQAFASGVLRGDEFNTMAEAAPVLMDTLAKSLGKPRSALRAMAEAGELTAAKLVDAFSDPRWVKAVDDQFAKIEPTITSRLQVLENAVVDKLGELDKKLGGSALFGGLIQSAADNIDVLVGVAVAAFGATIPSAISATIAGINTLTVAIAANPFGALAVAISATVAALVYFKDEIKPIPGDLATLSDYGSVVWDGLIEGTKTAINWIGDMVGKTDLSLTDILGYAKDFAGSFADFMTIGPRALVAGITAAVRSGKQLLNSLISDLGQSLGPLARIAGGDWGGAAQLVGIGQSGGFKTPDALSGFGKEFSSVFNQLAPTNLVGKGIEGLRSAANARAKKRIMGDIWAGWDTINGEKPGSSGGLGATSGAVADAAKASKAAAKANDELDRSLDSLRSKFDPAADAAAEYSKQLAEIAKLEKAGKFSSDPNENRVIASKYRDAAQKALDDQRLEETQKKLSATMQDAAEPLKIGADYAADTLADGGQRAGRALYDEGLQAAQAIAQIIGGSVGGTFGKIIGGLQGLSTGNFNGVGGKLGGLLTLFGGGGSPKKDNSPLGVVDQTVQQTLKSLGGGTFQDGLKSVLDPIRGTVKDLGQKIFDSFGIKGTMSEALGKVSGGAAVGTMASGVMKALGIKTSQTGAQIGGAIGSFVPIPGGSIIGSIAGGLIGGLFKKSKVGSANLTSGDIDSIALSGNSSSRKDTAAGLGASVIQGLQSIAEQLGGSVGTFSTSIGVSGDSFHVDTSGRGKLKKSQGGFDFDQDQEAAIKFAIADAVKDGAIQGLRAGTQALLQGGSDLDTQLAKAVKFENVFKELKQRTDPVGAAIEDLNKQFGDLKKVFTEAGASTAEWADLEKLYQLKRQEIIEQGNEAALSSMRDYLSALKGGTASPLSPQIRYANALSDFSQLDAARASGGSVDFDKYRSAADSFLSASRDYFGSTTQYFNDFNRVTSGVQSMIDKEASKTAPTYPTVDMTPVVSAVQDQTTVTTTLLQQIRDAVTVNNRASAAASLAANDTAVGYARYYLNY